MGGKDYPQKIFKKKLLSLAIISLLPCFSYAKIPQKNPLGLNWTCSADKDKWKCYETNNKTEELFIADADTANKDEIVAQALGWIIVSDPDNFCGGYYYVPNEGDANSQQTKITGNQAKYKLGGSISLQGGVEIQRGKRLITANQVTLTPNKKTNKIESIESSGDVNLRSPGQLIISNKAVANVTNNTAKLTDTYYLLKVNANPTAKEPYGYIDHHFTGYGRGQAKEIIQHDKNRFTLKESTYTTGSPYDHAWKISASEIDIDKAKGWATVYNGTLDIQDVPIVYLPYITFPINRERKSGFLFPQAGQINDSYFFGLPYYFNLAPDYDLLFTPTYYLNRGLMLAGNFRYLTERHEGSVGVEYIPDDTQYEGGNGRGLISITDNGHYGKYWTSTLNYSQATDKSFISDFSNNIISANQSLLTQAAGVKYEDNNLLFSANLLNYQILDNVLFSVNSPYSTLPQIDFNAEFPTAIQNLSFGIKDQYTFFYKPATSGQSLVNGQRLYITPYIAAPFQKPWGYIKPSIALSETAYSLTHTAAIPGAQYAYNSTANRTLPLVNVDAGLYFDRKFDSNDNRYSQTLEPKLFYNYIPYQNQDDIPLFDTNFSNFTYASLFETNRFTGYDRINNANQITYALETNINNTETGSNIFSAGIGQIYYFQEQKVTLCDSSAIGNANCIQNENPNYNEDFSSIASYANYQFVTDWYLLGNITYQVGKGRVDLQDYGVMYKPDPRHILNLSYQNILNDYALITPQDVYNGQAPPSLTQITASSLWGITEKVAAVGLYSYSFSLSKPINMFAGLQYDECSWSIRFLYQRYISSLNTNSTTDVGDQTGSSWIFSFTLKGLAGSSQQSVQTLLETIPGYEPFYSGIE